MIIGLSGKYCAGKNTAAELLSELGFYQIDVDKLGHSALEEKTAELAEIFGKKVLAEDGSIDRKKLGAVVFSSAAEMEKLEKLVHPPMIKKAGELARSYDKAVLNAAILYKMGLNTLCSFVIWVDAPFFIRFFRAVKRDRLKLPALIKRLVFQNDLSFKPLKKSADTYIIKNTGNRYALKKALSRILEKRGVL